MWASGDYPSMVETFLLPLGPRLVEGCEIGPGMRVLDVAAGTGNAAIPAAGAGATVVASDLTPELFEPAAPAPRPRASSWSGSRPTPRTCRSRTQLRRRDLVDRGDVRPPPPVAADEMVRVCRPGGKIGLLSWTPEGMIGALFRMMRPFMPPPPPGAQPPPLWGSEEHLREMFGERVEFEKLERDDARDNRLRAARRLRRALQAALRADDRGAGQRGKRGSRRPSSTRR